MRRLIVSLLCLGTLVAGADVRSLADIQKSGVLRVAVDGQTPGFNYYEGKKLTGLEVELAEAIAKGLGVKTEFVVQPFNTLLVALGQGRFDLIATSHARTPEREKIVRILAPHYCTSAVIVSRAGGPKTEADLAGKVVAVPVGTTYSLELKKNKSIKTLKTMPDETAGLQDLLGNRADVWVTEEFVAAKAKETHPTIQIGQRLFPQTNGMVVAKENAALQNAVEAQLARLTKEGVFGKLSQKYFQKDISCH